ncbi:MAG: hypothetical protein CMJ31_04610 [Phycisphaerae bacterium]|nr:hypothetical protein [Phycisphaerae bacterium]
MAQAKSTDPNVFILPDLGEGVHEAELIAWKVKVGDTVKEHQVVAEMETDKALVEVPSPRDGVIQTLHGKEGETLHVGNPLVSYEGAAKGGATQQASRTTDTTAPEKSKKVEQADAGQDEDAGTVVGAVGGVLAGVSGNGKVLAAPAVRRLARDLGVDLENVEGSGIGGRVTAKDVRAFAEGGGSRKPSVGATSQRPTSSDAPRAEGASPRQTSPAPEQTRRPLYPMPGQAQGQSQSQPSYQPPHYPQPHHAPAGYGQPQPGYMPMPYPQPMPAYGYPYIPMPYPMPMPGYGYPQPGYGAGYPQGYGQSQPGGVPHAPGFTPFPTGRPIPDPAQTSQPGARVPFRGVRRTIAQRLRDSVNTAVHFTVVDEADVTELDAMRRAISEQSGVKLSFLPFVGVAVCRALAGRFGALNATVDDENQEIVQHGAVHLGIATDTESGLMVPVIPNASAMDAVTLGQSIADTARAARDRSLPRERLMGSTFTISNVGSHAGRFATPVINYPEVGILAVGKVYDGVVVRDGEAVVGKVMPLSLACDHRVVDGATAALCLAEIVGMLRDPGQLA